MNARRGSTMIEMVISMGVGSSLMLLGIGLVHQSFRLSRNTQSQSDIERSFSRLSQQFREDVHGASDVSLRSNDSIELAQSDEIHILYRRDGLRLVREYRHETEPTATESYLIGPRGIVSFEFVPNVEQVTLRIDRERDGAEPAPRLEVHRTATLNRWNTLESSARKNP